MYINRQFVGKVHKETVFLYIPLSIYIKGIETSEIEIVKFGI
jgi:hypothetical protein